MKISIVMPVYNSERYLRTAIDSILNQSFTDFELILVDDCSKDNSPAICDQYANMDSRIRVYHAPQNGGICRARNKGMEMAQADYIAFCDDDDDFLPGLLEENIVFAEQNDADMVKFGRRLIDVLKDGSIVRTKETKNYGMHVYHNDEKYSDYYEIKSRGYLTNLWNGIYRLSTIRRHNLKFDETMHYGSEDMDFSLRLFDVGNCIVINPKTFYVHYRRDASSTSRKFSKNKIDSMIITSEHELPIWRKMPNGVKTSIEQNQMASEILRNIITIQLLHEKCPYTIDEKVKMIEQFCLLPQFNFDTRRVILKELFKIDKKSFTTIFLCKKRMYRALISILRKYKKIFGDRWE